MTAVKYDVVGIGNAIVDIIGRCDDAFLVQHNAPKGNMRLVDPATLMTLYDAMGPAVETSGGSAANTIAGIASLGGKTGFIGKIADDEFGRIFSHDIRAQGVTFTNKPIPSSGDKTTSRSLILPGCQYRFPASRHRCRSDRVSRHCLSGGVFVRWGGG
jgi:sugar/nucleoside kinase (ribokinase family)